MDSVMAARLKDYVVFPEAEKTQFVKRAKIVEINGADSTTLVSLSGIGEGSVMHIIPLPRIARWILLADPTFGGSTRSRRRIFTSFRHKFGVIVRKLKK